MSDEKGGLSELCRALCRSAPDVQLLLMRFPVGVTSHALHYIKLPPQFIVVTYSPFSVPPSTPVLSTGQATSTTTAMTWTQLDHDNIVSYNITWRYNGRCVGVSVPDGFEQVLNVSIRSYTDQNLYPNSQYVISIAAINSAGSSRANRIASTRGGGICILHIFHTQKTLLL